MPSCSLVWLFKQIHLQLINIRDSKSEVFSPTSLQRWWQQYKHAVGPLLNLEAAQ
jgi:hypothetical protein